MSTYVPEAELDISPLRIAYGNNDALKGKLFAATPLWTKPEGMSADTWAVALVRAASRNQKDTLAIPLSFWPAGDHEEGWDADLGGIRWIAVMDQIEKISNANGQTPGRSLQQIVDALKAGQNVLLLSGTKDVSGFVPAILSKALHPSAHVEKIAYPIIEGMGYSMTPFQLGYLYGMSSGSVRI